MRNRLEINVKTIYAYDGILISPLTRKQTLIELLVGLQGNNNDKTVESLRVKALVKEIKKILARERKGIIYSIDNRMPIGILYTKTTNSITVHVEAYRRVQYGSNGKWEEMGSDVIDTDSVNTDSVKEEVALPLQIKL